MKLDSDLVLGRYIRVRHNCDAAWKQNDNWQVVYETKEGLDYCRETYDKSLEFDEVLEIAEMEVKRHRLGSAVIDRF